MKNGIRIARSEDVAELVVLLNELFSMDLEFEPNNELQKKGCFQLLIILKKASFL